jgi:hypothetical protein
MKVMIRGKTISYSSYKNKEKNKSESDLGKQLSELYANNGKETEIQDTENYHCQRIFLNYLDYSPFVYWNISFCNILFVQTKSA